MGTHFLHTILPLYVVGAVGFVAMTAYFNRETR